MVPANYRHRTSSKSRSWRIRLGLRLAVRGSIPDETPHMRKTGLPNRSTVHLAKTAPALTTTNAIENANILKSFPAGPPSIISSVNPNFFTLGCPGGRISLSYLFTSLVNPFTLFNPDSERTLELTRDASLIGSEASDDAHELHPFDLNFSFHSRPCSVTGSP